MRLPAMPRLLREKLREIEIGGYVDLHALIRRRFSLGFTYRHYYVDTVK
jgi:hypothetical protein